jgi:hypothetical protein
MKGTQKQISDCIYKILLDDLKEELKDDIVLQKKSFVVVPKQCEVNYKLEKELRLFTARDQLTCLMNIDSYSSCWVSQCPDLHGRLNNMQFRVTFADYMALDVPIGSDVINKLLPTKFRDHRRFKRFDPRGYAIRNTKATDFDYSNQHDFMVNSLCGVIRYGGIQVMKEKKEFLGPIAPMDGNTSKSNSIRPDLVFECDHLSQKYYVDKIFGDVKCLHMGSHYDKTPKYQIGHPCHAIENRAVKVTAEYMAKAKAIDKLAAAPRPEIGPCLRYVTSQGTVTGLGFGTFGEVSRSVKTLVSFVASEVAKRSKSSADKARSKSAASWMFKRWIGMDCLRSKADLLIGRDFITKPNPEQRLRDKTSFKLRLKRRLRQENDDFHLFMNQPWAGFFDRS